jgi:hypothetical protein
MKTERIIEMAEALADIHRGRCLGGDPITAFKDLDVSYFQRGFPDPFDGLLRYKRGAFEVFVNTDHARTLGRRRFTAGHELGHFTLPHHRQGILQGTLLHQSSTGFQSDKQYEYEADIFASHFLMPTAEVESSVRSKNWGAEEILAVSQGFGSSIISAAIRCQQALSGDSTLIFWKDGEYSWSWSGGSWGETPFRSIRSAEDLVRGSATERVLNSGMEAGKYIDCGGTKSFWSRRVAHWSSQNDILIEYAISLGQYGVLTLLRPDGRT